jgi:FSR family fosmidomycin resistance protein-like MFS transporter
MSPHALNGFSAQPHATPEPAHPAAVKRLIWLVGFSHAANHFVMLVFPAVLLLVQQEFDLGLSGLGILASVSSLCYGLAALPAGMLADRFGGERVLAVWLLGAGLACIAIGFSTGPWSLGAGLALLGLFASLHHPAGSGVLVGLRARLGPKVGRAFGLSGILGNIGLAASPVLAAAIGVRWGWRTAFFLSALPGWLLVLPLWRHPGVAASESRVAPHRESLRNALTLPLILLFALETLMGFIFQGFSTFLPAYLAGHAGIAAITAEQVRRGGAFASLSLLFGGLGHLAAGRLMGSRHQEAAFLIAVTASTLGLFSMGLTSGGLLVLFSILLSCTYFALGTISNTFVAHHTPPRLGGTVFGVTFTLAFGVGSLASTAMGVFGEAFGLPVIFLGLGAVGVGGVALVAGFLGATGAWRRVRSAAPSDPREESLPSDRAAISGSTDETG